MTEIWAPIPGLSPYAASGLNLLKRWVQAFQPDARVEDRLRRRLCFGNQGAQSCALSCVEIDDVFLGCHDRYVLSVEPDRT